MKYKISIWILDRLMNILNRMESAGTSSHSEWAAFRKSKGTVLAARELILEKMPGKKLDQA